MFLFASEALVLNLKCAAAFPFILHMSLCRIFAGPAAEQIKYVRPTLEHPLQRTSGRHTRVCATDRRIYDVMQTLSECDEWLMLTTSACSVRGPVLAPRLDDFSRPITGQALTTRRERKSRSVSS